LVDILHRFFLAASVVHIAAFRGLLFPFNSRRRHRARGLLRRCSAAVFVAARRFTGKALPLYQKSRLALHANREKTRQFAAPQFAAFFLV
jgi:hypothetical protein